MKYWGICSIKRLQLECNGTKRKEIISMDYLKEIKKEFPKIKEYMEDDFDWENEARKFIRVGKPDKAEIIYKKLCLSQPEHHAGFEGLAEIYEMENERVKAEWFMKEALIRAKRFLKNDSIDKDVIDEMEDKYRRITGNEEYDFSDLNGLAEADSLNKVDKLDIHPFKGIGTVNSKTIVKDIKIGRNDFCPCGSGKKFKKCCGR
jgi:hypothetical protein